MPVPRCEIFARRKSSAHLSCKLGEGLSQIRSAGPKSGEILRQISVQHSRLLFEAIRASVKLWNENLNVAYLDNGILLGYKEKYSAGTSATCMNLLDG